MTEQERRPERRFDIVTDAASDLSFAYLAAHDAAVVPMRIRLGGQDLADDADLFPAEFYERVASGKAQPTTSQPSPADVSRVYDRVIARGAKAILSVHVSGGLSETVSSATTAARDANKQVPCRVFDTTTASAAEGLVVRAVVMERDRGASLEEALERADEVARHVSLYFVAPSTSTYAAGRGFGLLARLSGSLPMLHISKDGTVVRDALSPDLTDLTGRIARIMSRTAAQEGPLMYVEVAAGIPRLLEHLEKPLDTNEFESRRVAVETASPSVATHAGIGAVGIAFAPVRHLPIPNDATPKGETHV
jgi:DegV family protein with EDD domain